MIDGTTGVVRVANNLDFETVKNYSLEILAIDKETTFNTGTATLVIEVMDVNDNTPICTSSLYTGTVAEDDGNGTEVADVDCTDNDASATFNTLKYSITSTSPEFAIDEDNGKITIAQALDAEVNTSYTLTLQATDGSLSETVTVSVTVTNVNDKDPQLSNLPSPVTIAEDIAVGSTVFDVNATDSDVDGTNFIFSITSGDDGKFTIGTSTGIIQIQKTIDRETMTSALYTLIIEVADGIGADKRTATNSLVVTVTDLNDNSPQCDLSIYTLTFEENKAPQSSVITPSCSDPDQTASPALRYTLTTGNASFFGINTNTGELSILQSLNYETTQTHTLTVDVSDQGTPERIIEITMRIYIDPVNENDPVFQVPPSNPDLDEDTPLDTIVVTVSATDADQGLNHGTVRYGIKSGNNEGKFSINPSTGRIVLSGPLNYESVKTYSLIITAADMSEGDADAKTVETTITVTVNDINDNYPVISPASYVFKVNENAIVGTSVGKVTATDDDSGLAGTAGLVYTITGVNTNNAFATNGSSIVVNGALSAVTQAIYVLTVEVKDQGNPTLSSQTKVSLIITAINEHAPGFSVSVSTVSISEDEPVGNSIWQAVATDADDGEFGVLRYYMASGNNGNAFTVDLFNGDVRVANALDYDTPPTDYTLEIRVEDTAKGGNGTKSSTATLTVSLIDANDESPAFTKSLYEGTLDENGGLSDAILTVTATDSDTGNNGKITYTIVSGTETSNFNIDSDTGAITTAVDIDFENRSWYHLIIQAEDTGAPKLSATCLVQIKVNDLNDNTPTFPYANIAVSVSEDVNVGDLVATAIASDADSGSNGNNVIEYTFDPSTTLFQLDQSNGQITVMNRLDRELAPK